MSTKGGFLVIGGDSLVGAALVTALERREHETVATTRRANTLGARRVFLDFGDCEGFRAPTAVTYAFIVAAATNYERCEKDPTARTINVECIPRLARTLLEQGLFVTFISTNSVFGGERPWPAEDDEHAPGIAYARQKSEGEAAIRRAAAALGALDRLNVVRLTKVLGPRTPPLPEWFAAWERGQVVQPFSDFVFAPMSVRFVGEALATIGEKRISGNLHLSGAENVTYVDFANELAERLGVGRKLIAPTTAVEKEVRILFKPRFSGIGMARTTALTGIRPQPLGEVVQDVLAARRLPE
jgi:dTDP-4-dehydrorhamnose reductase